MIYLKNCSLDINQLSLPHSHPKKETLKKNTHLALCNNHTLTWHYVTITHSLGII